VGAPLALSWILLAYAAVAVIAGCAFAALRIHDDYLEVMQEERVSLRGAASALTSATQAMLYDGVGAALAAAGAIRAEGGLDRLPHQALAVALQRQLTGGTYMRSLFLADGGRFVLASRTGVLDDTQAPRYMAGLSNASEVWVGAPMADPQAPSHWVVPIARRAQTAQGVGGWAGALISFTGLEQLNRRFGNVISEQGLIGFDGTVLVSEGDRYTGRSVAQLEIFRRAVATARRGGIVTGRGAFTTATVIYAYYPLRGYPVYVIAGQDQDTVLAGWRARRRQMIAAAAFSALVLVLTAFLNHYMRALRIRERDYNTLCRQRALRRVPPRGRPVHRRQPHGGRHVRLGQRERRHRTDSLGALTRAATRRAALQRARARAHPHRRARRRQHLRVGAQARGYRRDLPRGG
jgi:hypothetical protein